MIHITDSAFLGRVGPVELGAIAIADTVVEIVVAPAIGLAEAMQIIVSRRVGEQRERAVGAVFNRTLVFALCASIVLAAAVKIGSAEFSDDLIGSQAVAEAVDDFLQSAAYGVVFMSLSFVFSGLYVGVGRQRALIGATLVLTLTNLALSYVFIFGEFGLPELGMKGAGIGFAGAEAATLFFLVVYGFLRLDWARFGLFTSWDGGGGAVSLLRTSSPVVLQALLETTRWLAFFLIVERISAEALAASNIVYAVYAILLVPTFAFSEATYTLVSRLIGRGESERVRDLIRAAIRPLYAITLPLCVFAVAFPDLVLSVFTSDQGVIDASESSLRLVAAAMVILIPAELWLAAVFGTGDTDAAFLIELVLSVAVIGLSYAAAFTLDLPLPWVWFSVAAASLLALLLAWRWILAERWRTRTI